jgi:Tol biopolymer transport system component
MKPITRAVLLLAVLTAGAWVVSLSEVARVNSAPPGPATSRGEVPPYPGSERLIMRRVVADAHWHSWPSPEGMRLSVQGYSGDLAIVDLATGESRFLTGDSTDRGRIRGTTPIAFTSRFSPDGQQIAYEWSRDSAGDTIVLVRALHVLDLETGEVRELLHRGPPAMVLLGSWSPDGQAVAAVLRFGSSPASAGQIALVRVADGSITEVATFESRAPMTAIFSPDGRWLAYHRVRDADSDEHDVFLRSVDGALEHRLTRGPGDHRVAGWLPHGGPFFYLSGERSRFDLLAVELEDGRAVSRPRLVRSDLWRVSARGFSENAFFFLQMSDRIQAHTARIDLDAGRLTSPLTPLFPATSASQSSRVAWSPDGDRLAFMDGADVVVRSLATGAERRIRTGFRANATIEWSPVAERLAIWGQDLAAGTAGIHILDLADGSVEPKLPHSMEPRWSPDGKALFVGRTPTAGPGYAIVRVDLETGEEAEVYRTGEYLSLAYAGFAPDPDGRHVAVGERNPAPGEPDRVILVPLDGGQAHELVRVDAPQGISYGPYGLEWTPDGRQLIISSNPDAEQRRTLWIVDRDGTRLRELASFPATGTFAVHSPRPRFHSGGREISVMAGRNRWELWTLEDVRAELMGDGGRRR